MESRKRAIIVGCSKYDVPEIRSLKYAEQDAAALHQRLTHRDIGGYDETDIELLQSPTADKMRRAFERLLRNARPDDRLLLYFAGHGLRDDTGRMHLALADTDPELVRSTGVAAHLVRELMDECRSKHICLILDCCFSGAIAGTRAVADLSREEVERGVASLTGHGTVILTSAQSSQQARERDDYGHGVFTYYLLQGLDGAADADADGVITPQELYGYVAHRMEYEVGKAQRPTFMGNLVGGTFPLAHSQRRRTEALDRLVRETTRLREQQLHGQALALLAKFSPTSSQERAHVTEAEELVRREMRELRAAFRRRVFEDSEKGLTERVSEQILACLSARPDELFANAATELRQRLVRGYFLRQLEPNAVAALWPADTADRQATPSAQDQLPPRSLPQAPSETPPGPSDERMEGTKDIDERPPSARRWKRYGIAALVIAASGALWVAMPRMFLPLAFDPAAMRVGVLLKREWTDPDAKQTFRLVLEEFNARAKANGLTYQFKTGVEIFSTVDEVVDRFRAGQIELAGELSPYDIYLVNTKAGAQPFLSPRYGRSNTYNAVYVTSARRVTAEQGAIKEESWNKLVDSLAGGEGRLAYTDESSTSGYWFPRRLILNDFQNRGVRKSFRDVTVKVGSDEFVESIACGRRNVVAGVIAEFRLPAVGLVSCGEAQVGLVRIRETEPIHNGAWVLRRELATRPELVTQLQQSWANAIERANASSAIKLETTWSEVEINTYSAEFGVFRFPDPVAGEQERRRKMILVASACLLLITSLAYIWVTRLRTTSTRRERVG